VRYRALALVVGVAVLAAAASAGTDPRGSTLQPGWDEVGPQWSPGGRVLLVSQSWESKNLGTFYDLAVVAPGERSRDLGRHEQEDLEEWDLDGVWSPSGDLVAFTRRLGLGHADYLYVSGVGGSGQRRLSPAGEVHDVSPTWSPDGRRIAFVASDGISVVDDDGSNRRLLVRGPGRASSPRWSPDGALIAFELRESSRFRTSLFVVRPDGTELRRIAPESDYELGGWSPDSSRLLAVDGTAGGGDRMLLVRADGSGPTILAPGTAPDWSPAGDRIAFFRRDGLYVLPRAGGTARRVYRFPMQAGVNDEVARRPDWSPDGRRIAFAQRGECVAWGVYVLELATGRVERASNDCRVIGTRGRDVLRGTSERDVIRGLGGADLLDGNPGDRPIPHYGRDDDDLLDGGSGADTLRGRRGADVLLGGSGSDSLRGERGADRLVGGGGNDVLDGGRYFDRLDGGAGADVIVARDGFRDRIACGAGVDRVSADLVDVVARDCERVSRRAA
jgi:Tol biopolymer transport system component